MFRPKGTAFVFLVVGLMVSGPVVRAQEAAQVPIEGEWVGAFALGKEPVYLRVQFKTEGQGLKLTVLRMLPAAPLGSRVTDVRRESSYVRFEVMRDAETLAFDGQVQGDTISGVVEHAKKRGIFQLVRIVPMAQVDPKLYKDYGGAYEVEPNRTVFIRQHDYLKQEPPFSVEWSRLYYMDESGRESTLYPSSETTFFAGPTYFIPLPVEVEVTFVRNQERKVTGLLWREQGRVERFAPRSKLYRQEEVVFQNGDVTLAGRLLVPSTKGPHPAVVLARCGDWPMNRNHGINIVADVFARHGITALVYDGRGTGGSTGDWREAGPDDLLGDVLAAVQFLRGRKDINPQQVGIWGISDGGVVASHAASRSKDVAFLIIVSVPALPQGEGAILSIEARLRADGLSEKEIKEAVAFTKLVIDFFETGEGWDKVEAGIQKARDKKWFSYTGVAMLGATSKDHWLWRDAGRDRDPDSGLGPVLSKVSCPVLAIWGELDTFVPPTPNKTFLEKALREGGNRDFTLTILPRADHELWLTQTGSDREFHLRKTHLPSYFETMTQWLQERLNLAQ